MATKAKAKAAKAATEEAPQAKPLNVTVAGIKGTIDWKKLSLGEQVFLERYLGKSMPFLTVLDLASAAGTVALATIVRRRSEPGWSVEETEALLSEEIEIERPEDERPTTPATSGSPDSG